MVSMGTVWDRTAEFLSDNLGGLLPLALGAIFVPSAISGSLSGLQQTATPGLAMGLGLASVALAIITFWGQLAITALALNPAIGRGAARTATRRLPAALLVTIVLFLALFLLAIPAGIILAASGADLSDGGAGAMPQIPAAAAPWLLLYFLVLIPVAVWLGARLLLIVPVIVGENAMFGAVSRSWALTRGAALRIVGVLILYAIVAWVAYLAATAAFGAIITLVAGRGEDGLSISMVLTGIVGGAVSTAFTVLGAAFVAKLYLALRAAKETVPA